MKLHELLAMEKELAANAQRATSKAKSVFTKGDRNLLGLTKTYEALEEEGQTFEPERQELVTTVGEEMQELKLAVSNYLDITIGKEIANQDTGANIEIDGQVVLENMPATALLNLESRLGELRSVLEAIPVNDPLKKWTWDGDNGYWVASPQVSYRTEKRARAFVAYEATEQHPAQVQVFNEDVRVGTWTSIVRSGMVAPVYKKELLERLDKLIVATKTARMRANDIEVEKKSVAAEVFAYLGL